MLNNSEVTTDSQVDYTLWVEAVFNEHGLKKTGSRCEILKLFKKSNRALTSQELEANASFSLHRVTVYRILKYFTKLGLLRSFYNVNGVLYYELSSQLQKKHLQEPPHCHFSCSLCGRVFCFNSPKLDFGSLPVGFVVKNPNLLLEGICQECHIRDKVRHVRQDIDRNLKDEA